MHTKETKEALTEWVGSSLGGKESKEIQLGGRREGKGEKEREVGGNKGPFYNSISGIPRWLCAAEAHRMWQNLSLIFSAVKKTEILCTPFLPFLFYLAVEVALIGAGRRFAFMSFFLALYIKSFPFI